MFDKLDQIQWEKLRHISDSPQNIPEQVRQLLTNDAHKQETALGFLFGSQQDIGSISEATPLIIPFILEILAMPDVKGKDHILYRLVTNGAG